MASYIEEMLLRHLALKHLRMRVSWWRLSVTVIAPYWMMEVVRGVGSSSLDLL